MTGTRICMYGIIVVALAVGPTFADTHTEVGDAGDLPATAQATGIPGNSLDWIDGAIGSLGDADMFAIWIGDLSAFGASTDNAVTGAFDTQLFLFDSGGLGVAFNDDGGSSLTSVFPVGSVAGPAGLYYIAVSRWDNDPSSAGGEIFPNVILSTDVEGPTVSGGVSPITSWGVGNATGGYRIDLTNAQAAEGVVIPLPAAVWAGLALLGGISLKRMRRRVA